MVVAKPSAPNAGAVLETERSAAVPVCSVIAPVEALMVGATPVIVPIFASRVPTVSVMSIELPTVPVFTNVRVVPSTTMVSPTAKFVVSELLGEAPDSVVATVIGAGVAALFKAAEPVTVASPKGIGGGAPGRVRCGGEGGGRRALLQGGGAVNGCVAEGYRGVAPG